MAKNFTVKDTGVSVISGKISKISDDKKSAVITVQVYDSATKERTLEEVQITSQELIEATDGQYVTALGFRRGKSVAIERLATENASLSLEGTEVLCGEVLFARLNTELNKDGSHRKTKAGTDKKPHYDVTIAVGHGAERETHTIKFYDFNTKNGKVEQVDRYKKLFENFDRKENPIYVAAVVDEGDSWIQKNTGNDGKVWENHMVSHMSAKSFDVNYINGKEQTKSTPAKTEEAPKEETQSAPTQETQTQVTKEEPVQAAETNGFEMEGLDLSGLEDLDNLDI